MITRRDLGRLADWLGPASTQAISLAQSIEVSMDTLFSTAADGEEWSWPLTVCDEQVHFRLSRQSQHWKAYADELESALSLWLYFSHRKEQGGNQQDDLPRQETGDMWLRSKGTPEKPSLQVLGPHTAALYQDIQWWTPDGVDRVVEVHKIAPEESVGSVSVEAHRVVGFASDSSSLDDSDSIPFQYSPSSPHMPNELTSLAVESFCPLVTLYSQYMFSTFMWAAARIMKQPIEGTADIRPMLRDNTADRSAWRSITLHNAQLSKLAQAVQSTGLGSLEEIYLLIVPPLSRRNRLPRVDAIVEWALDHATPNGSLDIEHWGQAAVAYIWLVRKAKMYRQPKVIARATALLLEFLTGVIDTIKIMKVQLPDKDILDELESFKSLLCNELLGPTADDNITNRVMGLYKLQGRPWGCPWVQNFASLGSKDHILGLNEWHLSACKERWDGDWKTSEINEKDIFDWTPLHYAASQPSRRQTLADILTHRPNIHAQDIRKRTPLHLAC